MSESHVDAALQGHLAAGGGEITLTDAAKIVGCWRALQNPENKRPGSGPIQPLSRAIAFTNTIKSSKRLEAHWDGIVGQAVGLLPDAERPAAFRCETRHVDGQHHALDRKARIEWLKGDSGGACRILSNARCLSEGIDVPALDAVLFMSPRNSQVDIVQAVGRAMRKAPGKQYGYIVLPIAVPAGVEPAAALDDNERFAAVWSVLRALRSHDDRFDAEINKIDLNDTPTNRIIIGGDGMGGDGVPPDAPELPFPPLDLPPGAIFAKIVEKCGDRKYWETWARDVADIFSRLVYRIGAGSGPSTARSASIRARWRALWRPCPVALKSDRPRRPGGFLWAKITSCAGPCRARHWRTRRSRVRRTPTGSFGWRRHSSSKMVTARRDGDSTSNGTTSLSKMSASGSERRRVRGICFCDGGRGSDPMR